MRFLAVILLGTPLWIIALFALFYFIPGLSSVVSKIFWEVFADRVEIFKISSSLLEKTISYNKIDIESLFNVYLQSMLNAALDAIFLGCCVFTLKSMSSFLYKYKTKRDKFYLFKYSHPEWLLNVVGICIGVSLSSLFGLGSTLLSNCLEGIVSIGLLAFGIFKIWTAGNNIKGKYNENSYNGERTSFLQKLLLSILVDAFNAIAAVNLITCVMEAPRMLHAGAYLLPVLGWCALSVGLMFLTNLLMDKNR